VEFGILGPVEVRRDGRAITIGGAKQRMLLAVLLLHANEVVSRDRLIEALWGERPPPSVHQSLDSYVSRLRRALGAERLVRRRPGYLLVVEPGELDLDRFDELVQAGKEAASAGDPARAAERLGDALGLWRGSALGDLLYEPFAATAAEQLEERRLAATEERIGLDLEAGGGADLVAELEVLVREHPLRERLLGQLMLALYRARRQAEALTAYQDGRHRLVGELGLEPGSQLRELERRILQQDPTLEATRPPVALTAPRRRALATLAGLAGLSTAVVIAVLVASDGSSSQVEAGHTDRVLSFAGGSSRGVSGATLSGTPSAVAAGFGSLWVAEPTEQKVVRVDVSSGSVTDEIAVGGQPGRVAIGRGAVWVASTLGGEITRIDPESATVTQTIRLGGANAADIAYGEGSVWVADPTDRSLIEIDPRTGSLRRTVTLDFAPGSIGVGGGLVWATGYESGSVEAISARSGNVVDTVAVGQGPSAIVVARDAVWVANTLDSTVSRIDPGTGSVQATVPVPSEPSALAAAGTSIWVASSDAGVVSEIDSRRNAIVSSRRLDGRPEAVGITRNRVWVGSASRGESHRGGTLTLVRTGWFSSIDPALHADGSFYFIRLAYDTLVTFQPASGPAGLRLLPDLALALPKAANGSTNYTFRLRPGIRYSDGRLLRASDFRRAFERLFRTGSPGASYYSGLVGAGACQSRPRSCGLANGIDVDDSARTVTFHLRAPDPDFVNKLTVLGYSAPVPPGTAARDASALPIRGTGPYRIRPVSRHELRLERNPFFREWSHAAQPAGNPDVIVWRSAPNRRAAVAEVAHGRADWFLGIAPPAELRALRLRYPSLLHANPAPVVEFVPLNTHRRPFDDVRVRQALNYAIDRSKIAVWYGGAVVATPLCQPLAPGLPGYRRYCPYTRHPRADGRWNGPDLEKARRLVAVSGTRGERVDVWGSPDQIGVPRQVSMHVAHVLRLLGYRVRLHLVPLASITLEMRRDFQLSVDGDWLPDYPAPSAYLPQFFGCGAGFSNGFVCDARLDRLMQEASRLQQSDPARAASLWAAADRRLVDRAYWVPTVNLRAPEFVSTRLRNYQFSPVGGFIADQVWLR
jgi:peptide/nickel transport system substrate-binding protein